MDKGSITCREPLGLEPLGLELGAERLGAERPQGRTNRTPTGYKGGDENLASFHPEMALFRNLCVNLRNHLFGVLRVRLRIIP